METSETAEYDHDKIVFANDFICYFMNAYNLPVVQFEAVVEQYLDSTYKAFNDIIKYTSRYIFNRISAYNTFGCFVKRKIVNEFALRQFIEYLKERYLLDGYNAVKYLYYCCQLAYLSVSFYMKGVRNAPDIAVVAIMEPIRNINMLSRGWNGLTIAAGKLLEIVWECRFITKSLLDSIQFQWTEVEDEVDKTGARSAEFSEETCSDSGLSKHSIPRVLHIITEEESGEENTSDKSEESKKSSDDGKELISQVMEILANKKILAKEESEYLEDDAPLMSGAGVNYESSLDIKEPNRDISLGKNEESEILYEPKTTSATTDVTVKDAEKDKDPEILYETKQTTSGTPEVTVKDTEKDESSNVKEQDTVRQSNECKMLTSITSFENKVSFDINMEIMVKSGNEQENTSEQPTTSDNLYEFAVTSKIAPNTGDTADATADEQKQSKEPPTKVFTSKDGKCFVNLALQVTINPSSEGVSKQSDESKIPSASDADTKCLLGQNLQDMKAKESTSEVKDESDIQSEVITRSVAEVSFQQNLADSNKQNTEDESSAKEESEESKHDESEKASFTGKDPDLNKQTLLKEDSKYSGEYKGISMQSDSADSNEQITDAKAFAKEESGQLTHLDEPAKAFTEDPDLNKQTLLKDDSSLKEKNEPKHSDEYKQISLESDSADLNKQTIIKIYASIREKDDSKHSDESERMLSAASESESEITKRTQKEGDPFDSTLSDESERMKQSTCVHDEDSSDEMKENAATGGNVQELSRGPRRHTKIRFDTVSFFDYNVYDLIVNTDNMKEYGIESLKQYLDDEDAFNASTYL